MVVFGVAVLVLGDHDQQIVGAGALLIAFINAAIAIGQWSELKPTKSPAGHEPPS
jgi:hypothetical protein